MKNLLALGTLLLFAAVVQAQSTTVTVRDRAGAIVRDAHLEILAGSSVTAIATTGEKGAAKVSLAAGAYRARVTTPGFVVGFSEAFRQDTDTPAAAEVTLFPGSALAGTVLDSGDRKMPGAELCVSLHNWRDYPPPAFGDGLLDDGKQCWKTDSRGRMVTPVLPLGQYDLSIEADDLVPRKTTLKLERDYPAQMWRLKRGGSIKGMVQDREEKPVENATVLLRHRELENERKGATDAEGRFEATALAAGPWSIRVEPRNAAVILRDGITVEEEVATDLGMLRVRPGLSIDGFVVDANGEPVRDAQIEVRQSDRVDRPLRTVKSDDEGRFVAAGLGEDPVNLLPQGLPLFDRHHEMVRSTTRLVDPETGGFCIEDVHPAEGVSVSATAAGYRAASTRVDVLPGQEAGPVELTLQRGLSLEGTVVGARGQPLPDAAVHARGIPMVYTDGFGDFRLSGLAAGMNKVIAEHPDYAMAKRDVMLPLGDDETFRIELGAGGTIEGTVTRSSGEPVEGIPVSLSEPGREQLTDAQGRFRFETVPPGNRTVTRKARGSFDDFEHRKIEVVENETVRVDFTLGVVLEGLVLRGGIPVPGVTIALAQPKDVSVYTDSNHAVHRTFSNESGAYRLSGVLPGWSTVTLETGTHTVVRQIEVPPGDTPHHDLHLPDRPIRGTVVNAGDGMGIGGANVTVTLAAAEGGPQSGGSSSYSSNEPSGGIRYNLTSSASSRTITDAAGNFETFADALPEVQIGASADGFRWTQVTVDPDSGTPVRIELSREIKLIVKLQDAQGNSARGTEVCAVRQKNDGNTDTSCSMGGFDQVHFSLDEGSYKVQASATGFGTKVLERELKRREDGSAHTLTVTLVPGAPLDIRLVGQPLETAKVVSLIDPTGADRTDLVRLGTVDPATGDRRWTTWTLDPGWWTLTVDDGSGNAIVREVEVVPGPPVEVILP
jgi:hypothetical protein